MADKYETQIVVLLNDQASKQYAAMVAAINKSTRQLVDVNGNVISSQKAVVETTKQVATESKKSRGVFDKLTGSVKGLVGAYVGMQGIRIATQFMRSSVLEAVQAEQAFIRLGAVLNATGKASQISAEQVASMAKGLQRLTVFDDDAIIAGQALLLEFDRIGAEALPRASMAMLDLATRTGDMNGAAVMLGKALQGEEGALNALRRSGIVFNDEQIKTIERLRESGEYAEANAIIFEKLEKRIGGSAEAAGDSASGQLLQYQNRWRDLKEEIGNNALPMLNTVLGVMLKIAEAPLSKSAPFAKVTGGSTMGISRRRETQAETDARVKEEARQRAEMQKLNGLGMDLKPLKPAGTTTPRTPTNWAGLDMSGIPELAILKQQRDQETTTQQAVVDGIQARIKANQDLQDQQAKIKSDKDIEIKQLEDEMRLRREGANDFVNNLEMMAKGSRKFSLAYKAAAISEALISTYESAMHAFKWGMKYGGPVAPFLAGSAAAAATGAGLARVNMIREQKFASGGIVAGNSPAGDNVRIRANSGEMVLTRGQQARLFDMAAGRGGGGGITYAPVIHINGGDVAGIKAAVSSTLQEQTRDFSRMAKRTQTAMV